MTEGQLLDESIDPASYVSTVRDWLIPEAVQRLIAAFANAAGSNLRDQIPSGGYRDTLGIVLEMTDTTPELLRDLLMAQRDWRPLALSLTALRCLETDCRAGQYDRRLPVATRDVLIAALQWQVELHED